MIPLCNRTTVGEPNIYPKGDGSTMVGVIKNCWNDPGPILLQDFGKMLG